MIEGAAGEDLSLETLTLALSQGERDRFVGALMREWLSDR
jgi:hypothetical protein